MNISEGNQQTMIGDDVSREYLARMANTFLRIDQIMSTITDLRQLLKLA